MFTPECGRPEEAFYCAPSPNQACMGRLHGLQTPGNGTRSLGSIYQGDLVQRAHALGLQVHVYTLRNEVGPSHRGLCDSSSPCWIPVDSLVAALQVLVAAASQGANL